MVGTGASPRYRAGFESCVVVLLRAYTILQAIDRYFMDIGVLSIPFLNYRLNLNFCRNLCCHYCVQINRNLWRFYRDNQ